LLAMLVASVSACACDHHGEKPVNSVPSCHAAAHEATTTLDTPSDNDRVDTFCNCYVRDPLPFVASTFANKKVKLQSDAPALRPVEIAFALTTPTANSGPTQFAFRPDSYSYSYRYRAPSRAPPRL
jgi:hypothetical protein